MMTQANKTTVKRSWADIVKRKPEASTEDPQTEEQTAEEALTSGPQHTPVVHEVKPKGVEANSPAGEDAKVVHTHGPEVPPGSWSLPTQKTSGPAVLVPGPRGSMQCQCRGKVLSMLSYYGWIGDLDGEIDHPLAGKHFGRVYLHNKDIVEGQQLLVGDTVSFYLYADHLGLGAEACRVESTQAAADTAPKMRAAAAAFVPGAYASEAALATHEPVSDVFMRMSRAFQSTPANGYVQMVGAINAAYFDSDSDSDEGEDADADRESVYDESDHSCAGTARAVMPKTEAAKVAELPPWKKKLGADRPPSPGMTSDSTNAGTSSGSDAENQVEWRFRFGKPSRPPPGLEDLVPFPISCT